MIHNPGLLLPRRRVFRIMRSFDEKIERDKKNGIQRSCLKKCLGKG